MAATLFYVPRERVVDANGLPISGAKLWFYEVGGAVTPLDTFSDANLTIPNTNPVVATAGGLFGPIFLSPTAYFVRLTTSAGVVVWDQDNVISPLGSASSPIDIIGVAGPIGGLTARQSVYLSDGSGGQTAGKWYPTDADFDYASRRLMVGFVTSAISVTQNVIRLAGELDGFAGLTIGARYYLSTVAGTITTVAPGRRRVIGQAKTATVLIIDTSMPPDLDFTTPAFNAGDFTGAGGGAWTVGAGDIGTYRYRVDQGNLMTVEAYLDTTTITGVVTTIAVKIPGGFTAQFPAGGAVYIQDNSAVNIELGVWAVGAGGGVINISRAGAAPPAFTASANLTYIRVTAQFEVTI